MENLFKAKPFSDDLCATIYDCVDLINSANRPRILKRLVVWPLYLFLFMYVPFLIAEIGAERFFDMGKQGTFDNYPTVVKLLLVLLVILILISLILFRVLMFLLIDIPLSMLFCLNMILIMVPYLTITNICSINTYAHRQGIKLREYLFDVMPKYPLEQGIMIQEPRNLWHKFLAKICTLVGAGYGTGAYLHYEPKDGEYYLDINNCYIRTITKEPRIVLWHELAHCVEKAAQPTDPLEAMYSNTSHKKKGARYEKRADLYAFRKAFRELSREEAIKEMNLFIKYMHQATTRSEDTLDNDAEWRAKLAERYVRRYYQQ